MLKPWTKVQTRNGDIALVVCYHWKNRGYIESIKMTSKTKRIRCWVTFYPAELYNLCDYSEPSCTGEEAFDRIRQWLNSNKDDNTRLKAALTYQERYNETPLHRILAIRLAFYIIQTLIEDAPEALKMRDEFGRLPIHHACIYLGISLEVIQALVNSYPESIKVTDDWGYLPLYFPCMYKKTSLEVLNFLIDSYPDGIDQKDVNDETPLDWFKQMGYAMDPDNNGMLPLHQACNNGYSLHLIHFLIQAYPESPNVQDKNGMLPLHHACNNGYSLRLIHSLIQAYPESTTVQDNDRNSPLQYLTKIARRVDERGMLLLHREAAHFKGLNVEILPILFHANPEAIRLQDKLGLLPIHHASLNEASSLDALMLLIKLYPEGIVV